MSNTISSSLNIGLPITPELSDDPKTFAELMRVYAAARTLQSGLSSVSNEATTALTAAGATSPASSTWPSITPQQSVLIGNMNKLYLPASEDIAFGELGNIWNSSGTTKVRKALPYEYSTTTPTFEKICHCICTTPGGVTSGNTGRFMVMQGIIAVTGVTPGTRYYLSTSPGHIVAATPAPQVGYTIAQQCIGVGIATDILYFNPELRFNSVDPINGSIPHG